MAEFFNVLPPADALALLFQHLPDAVPTEKVATEDALGRVTAEPVWAARSSPAGNTLSTDGICRRSAAGTARSTCGSAASAARRMTMRGRTPVRL